MKFLCWLRAMAIILAIVARADDCAVKTDHRSDKNGGIIVRDFTISGTRGIDSEEVYRISGSFIGSCFDDDKDDDREYMAELVRHEFQDHGFFTVEIKGISIKPEDPLGHPKPVAADVELTEGPRYRLSKLSFQGNRLFSSKDLAAAFPLHPGDLFARDKVATGLDSLRQLYLADGHLEMTIIPSTIPDSNGTVALDLDIDEGRQYQMGKFIVKGKHELADALQSVWGLREGAVWDGTYMDRYLNDNKTLLGEDFLPSNGVQIVLNCRENSVEVRVLLPGTPELSSPAPLNIDCDKSEPEKTN
jgi:outer membrane protein assembly factor BamA